MAARHKARKRALDILYAADLRHESPLDALARTIEQGTGPTNPYSETLVAGVAERQVEIDQLLSHYAQDWTLDRMPAVDRNALRIGAFELVWCDDIPDTVAVSEAVTLVRELSTDDSPNFVNGILGAIQRSRAAD